MINRKSPIKIQNLDKVSARILAVLSINSTPITIRALAEKTRKHWYTVESRIEMLTERGFIEEVSEDKYVLADPEKIRKLVEKENKLNKY